MNETFFDSARGQRLIDERKRLRLTQVKACEIASTHVPTWIRYEKGQLFKLDIVEPLERAGFDMMYVIFNVRKNNDLPESEQLLLRLFRSLLPEQRDGFIKLAQGFVLAHQQEGHGS